MRSALLAVAATAALVAAAVLITGSGAVDSPMIQPTISIRPADPIVFAGSSAVLRASVRGGLGAGAIRWTLVGPGRLEAAGLAAEYHAPAAPPAQAIVTAATGTTASATTVRTVAPPPAGAAMVLVACYEGAEIDVRSAESLRRFGEIAVGAQSGAISVDDDRRVAVVAARDRIVAINLATMRTKASPVLPAALFSAVTKLAGGIFAVADASARAAQLGVRFYRVDAGGTPVAAGGVAAGETPEGIVAERGGRTFYVSNVNGNSVMRFALGNDSRARLTGIAATATRPFGLALDDRLHLLLVADNDTPFLSGARAKPGLEAFDLPSLRRRGHAVSTGTANALPLGVVVDESTSRAFVTNEGDANVAVFELPELRRVATLRTGLTPWLPLLDPLAHRLLVPSARADVVNVFDARRLAQPGTAFGTCDYPIGVAIARGSELRRGR